MNFEDFKGLRDCCQSDAAFEQMQQILLKVEAERQQTELATLSLLGDRVRHAIGAPDRRADLHSLEKLIAERTADLQKTNEQLQRKIADLQWAESALQQSEQRFRSLIENATDIIVILDESGIFRYCSPSAKRVLGYTLEDVVGHSAAEFVHPADVDTIFQVLAQAIANPQVSQLPVEYRVRHRDGSWCLFEAVATNLLEDLAIQGIVINCHDITERKRAEEGLRAANHRIANILESITDAFLSLDNQWRFTYLNHRAEQLFQRSQAELLEHTLWEVFPEAIGSSFEHEYRRAMEQQTAVTFEEFHPSFNTWFEVRVFPSPDGLSIFLLDVTERRQAQAELLEMSTALGNAVEGIARLDTRGRYVALNRAYAAALGYQQEEMIGLSWQATVTPEDIPVIEAAYQHMQEEGKAEVEAKGLRKDGSSFYKAIVMVAAYDWHDRFVGHHCFTKDITERKQAEAALRESRERLRLTLEATQLGTWNYNPQTGIVTWSDSCERLFGLEPGTFGGTVEAFLACIHPEDLDRVQHKIIQQLQAPGSVATEFRIHWPDGSTRWISERSHAFYDEQGKIIQVLGVSMDITERKRAEEALRQQAERERLLGAIAQRIRNSLDLEAILNTTVSEVQQFLNVDRVFIARMTPTGDGLVTAESMQIGWNSLIGLRIQDAWFKQKLAAYQQGKPLVIHDCEQVKHAINNQVLLQKDLVKAVLAVPILHGSQLWGILVAHQYAAVRHWEPFEVGLLEQLATQVAIAIQQSELYQQVQQFNAELEELVQERTVQLWQALHYEAMLKRITDAVRDSLDESQILQAAVQELAMGLDVNSCGTGLYDLERGTSTISYEYICMDAPALQGNVIPMSKHPEVYHQLLAGQCLQFCWLFWPEDAALLGDWVHRHFSVLAYPIIGEQGVIGDLWIYKSGETCFEELEIRLVQQVANQCAIAIRQARLYQTAQAQVAALEELNLLKDDFLSTVSHELRTPMSNMKMAIHMLRSVTTPDRQERYLNILQTECVREIELINDLLDLQRLEASSYPVSLATINLHTCLMELVEPFLSRTYERQQTLLLNLPTTLPHFTTDKSALDRILVELLNNACKYTSPGGEVVFTAQLSAPAGSSNVEQIVFTISNQAEIQASEMSRIFERFYRIPGNDRWKQGGTGLGLALVQQLVRQLGGTIRVESENGWTTFTVQLPFLSSV